MLLTLNRKMHRAFNRVRELNFSLNGLVGWDLHGKTAGIVVGQRHFSFMITSISGVANWVYDRKMELPFQ